MFARLHKIVAQAGSDSDLPDEIDLGMPLESAWAVWAAWRAGKGRFLPYPGSLMDQPDGVMSAIWRLDNYLEMVQQQYTDQQNGNEQQRQNTEHPT